MIYKRKTRVKVCRNSICTFACVKLFLVQDEMIMMAESGCRKQDIGKYAMVGLKGRLLVPSSPFSHAENL